MPLTNAEAWRSMPSTSMLSPTSTVSPPDDVFIFQSASLPLLHGVWTQLSSHVTEALKRRNLASRRGRPQSAWAYHSAHAYAIPKVPRSDSKPKTRLRENREIIQIKDNNAPGIALFSWSLFLGLESLLGISFGCRGCAGARWRLCPLTNASLCAASLSAA